MMEPVGHQRTLRNEGDSSRAARAQLGAGVCFWSQGWKGWAQGLQAKCCLGFLNCSAGWDSPSAAVLSHSTLIDLTLAEHA